MTKPFQILVFLLLLAGILSAQDHGMPEGFTDQVLFNIDQPIGITFDDNGQGYLWDKKGSVFTLDTLDQLSDSPLINIREEVAAWWDHGLAGLALDPKFLENGFIYLLYVVDRHHLLYFGTDQYNPTTTITGEATIGRITRYTADAATNFTTIIPDSRKILLGETFSTGIPILFNSHGLGALAFGNDGTLLASIGDGASSTSTDAGNNNGTFFQQALVDGIIRAEENVGVFKSQLINSYNGKIIRIDPETGLGISSNPFYDEENPDSPQSKVWTLGLRNPFRMIVQPNSGSHDPNQGKPGILFSGDVGSNKWEELNRIHEAGMNMGWPLFEGFASSPNYWDIEITNQDAPNVDEDCNNFYLFQDLIQEISLNEQTFPNPCNPDRLIEDAPTFIHQGPNLCYRNVDDNFEPLALIRSFTTDGEASTLSIEDQNMGDNFEGVSAMAGCFYTGNSFPSEYHDQLFTIDFSGWINSYELDENGINKVHRFHNDCKEIVDLAVNPKNGCLYYVTMNEHKVHKICYGGHLPPTVVAEADQYYGTSPLTVLFDASASTSFGNIPMSYLWDFGDGQISNDQSPSHTFTSSNNEVISYPVLLTVTDSLGFSSSNRLIISINNTPPLVNITSIENNALYPIDKASVLHLAAIVSDQEHSASQLSYEWQSFLHHNDHFHTNSIDQNIESTTSIDGVGCQASDEYWYRIELRVTDEAGLVGSNSKTIFPNCETKPVEWINLTARAMISLVDLQWECTELIAIDQFIIQRIASDNSIQELGVVDASNSSSYSFVDTSPLDGKNTYRIKVLSNSKAFDFSNKVSVFFPARAAIHLYPNPANDVLNIQLNEIQPDDLTFIIFNAIGQKISEHQFSNFNLLEVKQISTTHFQRGVYFYKVIGSDFSQTGNFLIAR